jgi:uncharacterized protein
MTTEQEIVVALLSALSSFIAGLLGAGGDILYVPLLLYGLPVIAGAGLPVHTVTALSLVGSLASTGGGGLKHWIDGRVDPRAMRSAWMMLASAALVGGAVSRFVSAQALLIVFALVTTAAAVLLFLPATEWRHGPAQRDPLAAGLMFGTGLVCGAVGVGGGFLIVTILLHRHHMPGALARSTGLALTFFTAAPALIGKALSGQMTWSPVPWIVLAALAGVWIGAHAGGVVPGRALRWALAVLVVVLGVRVWVSVFHGTA